MSNKELRNKAKKIYQSKKEQFKDYDEQDKMELINELSIHQIELELQNEELMNTHQQLVESQNKYQRLYDYAPCGYVIFDTKGLIKEINLTGVNMLGKSREYLIDKPFTIFIDPDKHEAFYNHLRAVLETGLNITLETSLTGDNSNKILKIESSPADYDEKPATHFHSILLDITRESKMEQELNISNLYLNALFSNTPNAVLLINKTGNIDYVNQKAITFFKDNFKIELDNNDQLTKMNLYGLEKDIEDMLRNVYQSSPIIVDQYVKDIDKWLEIIGLPYMAANDKIQGITLIMSDITIQKVTELEYQRTQEQIEWLFEHSSNGIIFTRIIPPVDPGQFEDLEKFMDYIRDHEKVVRYNQTIMNQYSIGNKNIIGKSMQYFIEDENKLYEIYKTLLKEGHVHIDGKQNTKNGLSLDYEADYMAVYNNHGLLTGHICVQNDITEKKKTMEIQKLLAAVVETTDDAIYVIDLDGQVMSWNLGAEKIFGYQEKEMIGHSIFNIYSDPDMKKMEEFHEKLNRDKQVQHLETRFINKKHDIRIVSLTASPLLDLDGNIYAISNIVRDITNQKNDEVMMKELNLSLASSNRDLQQFAYIASHDLQEPLRTISSFLELIRENIVTAENESSENLELFDYVINASKRLKQMIKDLLNYSKLNQRENPFKKVDMNLVVKNVLKSLETSIYEVNADLSISKLPVVKGDINQIESLVQNIITNAIRYKKDSVQLKIDVSYKRVNDFYEFHIKDNGIGIPEKHYDRIFELFSTLHPKNNYESTGIGLAHCKKIIERHHGTIKVESKENAGSTFIFTLPSLDYSLTIS